MIREVQFFEEDFGMRGVNLDKNVFFVTKILHVFLIQHHIFSKKDFIKYFEISSEDANDTLFVFASKQSN